MDIHYRNPGISILFAGFMIAAGCVQAQQVSYSGSLQFATGSYFFEENTESFSFVNGLGLSGDNLSVSFSTPFIIQSSPWVSYGAAGYIPTGGPEHKVVRDSTGKGSGGGKGGGGGPMKASIDGANYVYQEQMQDQDHVTLPDTSAYTQASFGDPSIYANLKLYSSLSGATSIRLNSGLKFPLADPNSGFGTGQWDYGLGLSASQRIGSYFMMADLMKWWFGDLADLELKDPLTYSFGLGRSLGGGSWLINTTYSGYTEVIDGYDPPQSLNFGVGYFASDRVSLNSFITFGLSESSSDFSLGFGWNVKL